ncbi:MAG: GspE/PulE family protein [Patescibacteria group bacterium]
MLKNINDLIHQSQASSHLANLASTPTKPKDDKTPSEPKGEVQAEALELLNDVSEEAKDTAQALDEKMIDIELSNLERKAETEAQENGVGYINLKGFPISGETISLIPEKESMDAEAICFFKLENKIRVAVINLDNENVHGIISLLQKRFPGADIALYLMSRHSFELASALYKNVAKIRIIDNDLKITEKDITRFQDELVNYGVFASKLAQVNLTDAFIMIIAMALKVGSSDIHIEAEEKDVAIRYRVDGLLQVGARIPASIWPKLISRIKSISGLKLNVDSVPQDGRITIALSNDKMDIRVSTLPTAFGESVVMRLLKSSSVGLSFDDLGIRPEPLKRLEREIARPDGMIITTGPTGSGKTTTLYAILNKLNDTDTKIITLENPVEYKLQGIAQSQIEHSKGYTFSKGLRAILRQDPDIVMVGEIRDLETAETAIQAALTGHLLLSTIHTNDAAGAIPRFLSMGVAPFLLAPALCAVIGQRLVRRVCKYCKQEVALPFELLERVKKVLASIPENSGEKIPDINQLKFYKGQGCDKCSQTGYKGRVGIYEIFTMNEEIETITLSGKVSEYQMRDVTQKHGMLTMAQDGILKACEGQTHPEEIFRVASED